MKKTLSNSILIAAIFAFGGWRNVVNAQRIDISLHQADPRFNVRADRYWSKLGGREEYQFYVQNNTNQEYKFIVTFTLELACLGTKTIAIGFNNYVYLKPNGRFEPMKDDYYHYMTPKDDGKGCRITDGDSYTLLKQISYTISSVVNITEQKALEEKNRKEAEATRLKKIEDDKKARETETARLKKIEEDKKIKENQTNNSESKSSGKANNNNSSSSYNNTNSSNSNSTSGNSTSNAQTTADANRIAKENAQREFDAKVAAEAKRVADINDARRAAENTRTEQIQVINNTVNDWANNMASEAEARRQREYAQQLRREEAEERKAAEERVRTAEAAKIKAEKDKLIARRKNLIVTYPDGKTPLSYQAKENSEVYFFVYSYQPSTIENRLPEMYISNVFPVAKYGDGTWPFKAALVENIAKKNNGIPLILSGYYSNIYEAEQQQQAFKNEAYKCGFSINNIEYADKKSSATSSENTDFLGNPVIKTSGNEDKKNEGTSTPTTTPVKKEVKVDFWGNPIKE